MTFGEITTQKTDIKTRSISRVDTVIKAGMDMQEGTVVKWMKKEGDFVKQGEILLEIITVKVNIPTYSEALMEAYADWLGRCIHLPKK